MTGQRHTRRELGVDGRSDRWTYDVQEGVISGYPCTCSGGSYQIVKGLEIDEFSRERIDASVNELREERAAVELGLI